MCYVPIYMYMCSTSLPNKLSYQELLRLYKLTDGELHRWHSTDRYSEGIKVSNSYPKLDFFCEEKLLCFSLWLKVYAVCVHGLINTKAVW